MNQSSAENSFPSIVAYCFIQNGRLIVNGTELFHSDKDGADFFTELYALSRANYPKFFKMDNLSQLAFLTAEFLLKDYEKSGYDAADWSVVISCADSSLDADLKFWQTAQTNPSPAAFVYTLPNVMIGEICIRHGLKGENSCFIFNTFDSSFQVNYANKLLEKRTKACVHGWVNFFEGNYNAFLFLVEQKKEPNASAHSIETINKIITQYAGTNQHA